MTNGKSNARGTLTALMVAAVLMIGTVIGIKTSEKSFGTRHTILQADGMNPPAPPIKLGGSKRA